MTRKDDDGNVYNHPYSPYRIQVELMNEIYDTIENNYKVGIFESPTGTGKTLSIICSTMTWLRNYKKKTVFDKVDVSDDDSSDDEPEWVSQAYNDSVVKRSKAKIIDYELYLDKVQNDFETNKQDIKEVNDTTRKKRKKSAKTKEVSEEDCLPDDFYSDSESNKFQEKNFLLTKEIDELLSNQKSNNEEVEMVNSCPIKIYYSSRTHSQLKQFSDQLHLTKFQSSFEGIDERTKYTPLGSRKQLCINPKIRSISKNESSINDACLDERNSKEGCEYLRKDKLDLIKKFSDLSLTKIYDIEELGEIGTNLKVCPYYSVRGSVNLTEIISLPYQMLLQDSTRSALNLKIKDSIVVIDEAHNLLDVISAMNSVSINEIELNQIIDALKLYLSKFLKRLNIGNRVNLMKLIKICQVISNFIDKSSNIRIGEQITVNNIFGDSTGDLINIHKIETYLNKSKIAYKIESYLAKLSEDSYKKSSNPLLFKITKFLRCLNNPSTEGKFFWDKNNGVASINYMLLDPSEIFKDIVDQAKCILLCGGTMEPISDYTNYLFPYVPASKIKSFSCDHIIPDENLKVFPITNYEKNILGFSFDKRDDANNITNLGKLILELIEKVPYGVVVFFPSYRYLNTVLSHWTSNDIYNRIEALKKIFKEGESPTNLDSTLSEYSDVIQNQMKGAILLSVVGGKMSEGINFSNNLARAVIMVGLPFPNAFSASIIARRKFIESKSLEMGHSQKEALANSKNFYENICMRSINQSIGRSIRHLNDYSIIYLIDQRYRQPRIQEKLSGWVRKCIVNDVSTKEILAQTEDFFNSKLINKTN